MSSIVLHHGQQFFDAETLVSSTSRSLFDCCPKIIFQNNKDAVASTGESSSLKSPGKEIRSHTHTNTGRRRCSMCTLSLACVCVCVWIFMWNYFRPLYSILFELICKHFVLCKQPNGVCFCAKTISFDCQCKTFHFILKLEQFYYFTHLHGRNWPLIFVLFVRRFALLNSIRYLISEKWLATCQSQCWRFNFRYCSHFG